VALGGVSAPAVSGAACTARLRLRAALLTPSASVTLTLKFAVPVVVGVPLMAPVDALRLRPAGKLPDTILNVRAPVPPPASRVWVPIDVPLSRNVTLPLGVAPVAVTVAVRVTGWPTSVVLGVAAAAVVVGKVSWVTLTSSRAHHAGTS